MSAILRRHYPERYPEAVTPYSPKPEVEAPVVEETKQEEKDEKE